MCKHNRGWLLYSQPFFTFVQDQAAKYVQEIHHTEIHVSLHHCRDFIALSCWIVLLFQGQTSAYLEGNRTVEFGEAIEEGTDRKLFNRMQRQEG
jgi:hypothetical protein